MTPAYMAAATAGMAGSPLLPAPTDWEVQGAEPENVDAANRDYDPNDFRIERRIHIEGPEVARVEFHLSGHPKNRMLRIYETMPEGCRAEHDVLEKATVRFESQELIYSWFNAPKAERFKVSYRVMGDLGACLTSLSGHVEFAVGETTKVVAIPDCQAHQLFDPEGWLQDEVALVPREEEPEVPEAVNVPAPDPGVSFRVQVLAAHTHVKSPWFKQKFGFRDPIDAEPHESWIKYTTGSFADYASARNRREELAAGYAFPGPFVTAYEEGERITVQEALVLAQQEWIP